MEWLSFDLIERPYFDRNGNILESVAGRKNRPGIDEFEGGGHVYPGLGGLRILDWRQKGKRLMLLVDATPGEIDALLARTDALEFQASPKKRQPYGFSDFRPGKVPAGDVPQRLVEDCGLPEGTVLDENLRPVVPGDT